MRGAKRRPRRRKGRLKRAGSCGQAWEELTGSVNEDAAEDGDGVRQGAERGNSRALGFDRGRVRGIQARETSRACWRRGQPPEPVMGCNIDAAQGAAGQ